MILFSSLPPTRPASMSVHRHTRLQTPTQAIAATYADVETQSLRMQRQEDSQGLFLARTVPRALHLLRELVKKHSFPIVFF